MKKMIKKMACLAAALTVICSCNDWLEATSSTQVSDATLFSSRSGFQDALCGVYISMGSNSEYGQYWTWFMNELAYGPYASQSSPVFTGIQNHEWENNTLVRMIEGMWHAGYFSIANINKILYEFDEKPEVVSDATERNLMKGELLGLRAYIHFDLMRMFGLVQLGTDDFDKLTVPYVVKYDKEPTPQKSYRETLALLEGDIEEAITLLADDPIRGNASESFLANANADGFWDARNKRMNYFAVKALKARVLLFKSALAEAAAAAQEVIDETTAAGAFTWVDANAMTAATTNDEVDWTFSTEQLFCLEVSELQSYTDEFIFNMATLGTSAVLIDKQVADYSLFSPLFLASSEDIRGPALMLKFVSDQYRPYKLYNNSSYYEGYRNRIPMIKISEMYLIIAEVAAHSNDTATISNVISTIRSHRGITDPTEGVLVLGNGIEAVLLEYVKEFYGEGIPYYAARRLFPQNNFWVDLDVVWLSKISSLGPYPYPVDEVSYGRIQEL